MVSGRERACQAELSPDAENDSKRYHYEKSAAESNEKPSSDVVNHETYAETDQKPRGNG